MKQQEVALLMIKGAISDLPAQDREKVEIAARELREIVRKAEDAGVIALGLVGAEEACK